VPAFAGAASDVGIAIDPKYRFLYAVGGSSTYGFIAMFTITPSTGVLVPTSPSKIQIADGGLSQSIAVDGQGRFVYAVNTTTSTVSCFTIDQTTGILSPTTVPSVPTGNSTNGITADVSGKYVYAEAGPISGYVIDQTTGNLKPNTPAAVGGGGFAGPSTRQVLSITRREKMGRT
jgi:6-phosphogluconolactonase